MSQRRQVSLTVDVEDWYEGMAALGHPFDGPTPAPGLATLSALLEDARPADPKVTLFVVSKHAGALAEELREFAARGHEIASHGPEHGMLPDDPDALEAWLRWGRESLEDVVQVPVTGFRAPRFSPPASVALRLYRELIARAGFSYVSDTMRLGQSSPVAELPVMVVRGVPFGGGSYQRLLPARVTVEAVRRHPVLPVLYYHSYDFDDQLPRLASARSGAVVRQVLGRRRIRGIFATLAATFDSVACRGVVNGV